MRFRLPEWDEIPDFGLYMKQTVDLLRKYLDYLPPELKNEEVVTSSAINNYVRRRIMPGPIKKKVLSTPYCVPADDLHAETEP